MLWSFELKKKNTTMEWKTINILLYSQLWIREKMKLLSKWQMSASSTERSLLSTASQIFFLSCVFKWDQRVSRDERNNSFGLSRSPWPASWKYFPLFVKKSHCDYITFEICLQTLWIIITVLTVLAQRGISGSGKQCRHHSACCKIKRITERLRNNHSRAWRPSPALVGESSVFTT